MINNGTMEPDKESLIASVKRGIPLAAQRFDGQGCIGRCFRSVITDSRFVFSARFSDSILTVGNPKFFASRAHEEHTSIFSITTPAFSEVTR